MELVARRVAMSRIAAVIAWALLIEGAAWSTNVVREDAPYCPYLKDGIFAGGGVLTLAATALGIASFIMLRSPPAPAPPTPAAEGTPSTTPGMSSPAVGVPLLPLGGKPHQDNPAGKPQIPPTPTDLQSHPQQVLYTQQNLAESPSAPAQANGSHAPNQQQLPPEVQVHPAAAVAAAAVAATPSELSPPPIGIPIGLGQPPQVSLPQVIPTTIPVPQPGSSGPSALSTVIRNEVAKQGIRLAAHVVSQTLLSDNNNAGDGVLSMMTTDSAGGDIQDSRV
ncbi:hypothetical protein U9M48_044084 [Paspalum notatum var. saurae]|uniref:Uncharacterized protein n=1 Tax=Paspalum notatum var. saurae TaxID=547442 RepID=A0AAQ3UWA2_PASNO